MNQETLEQKIRRVTAEVVDVVAYDPAWAVWFESERAHLLECLPDGLIVRIEHFGSTAVPGLHAKPIVDMVIEITDEAWGKEIIPQVLEPQGYDCFWRPLGDKDEPPYFTWCIKRNAAGERTHHLHFVKVGFKDNELRFRDILRTNPGIACRYAELKLTLCRQYHGDRIGYTAAKGDFIGQVLEQND